MLLGLINRIVLAERRLQWDATAEGVDFSSDFGSGVSSREGVFSWSESVNLLRFLAQVLRLSAFAVLGVRCHV